MIPGAGWVGGWPPLTAAIDPHGIWVAVDGQDVVPSRGHVEERAVMETLSPDRERRLIREREVVHQEGFAITSIKSSAANVSYTYDGDGRRVQKSNGKLYWYGGGSVPLEETDSAGNTNNSSFFEYVFFGGQRIARRDYQNNVSYYYADHLGTSRVITNSSGTILDDSDFYPFGGERFVSSSSGNTYKFTGYEHDTESSLDYASARHYSNVLGRFMSPDPLGGSPGNPQSWNRYSYVFNNPLNGTDPSGMCGEEDGWSGCDWGSDWGSPDVYGWFWYSAPDYSFLDLSTNPLTGAYDPSTSFMQSPGLSSQFNFQQQYGNMMYNLNWAGSFFSNLGQNLNPFNASGTFSQEAVAIGQSFSGMLTGNWGQVANSYNNNPLGQTAGFANSPDAFDRYVGYYGTRAALIGSGAAATGAGTLSVLDALGVTNLGEWEVGWKGGEFTLKDPTSPYKSPDFRFNPRGKWTDQNWKARPPHWHQRPGIGRHLPWDWWF